MSCACNPPCVQVNTHSRRSHRLLTIHWEVLGRCGRSLVSPLANHHQGGHTPLHCPSLLSPSPHPTFPITPSTFNPPGALTMLLRSEGALCQENSKEEHSKPRIISSEQRIPEKLGWHRVCTGCQGVTSLVCEWGEFCVSHFTSPSPQVG